MSAAMAIWLVAAAVTLQPLTVEVARDRDVLSVDFALARPLPESFEAALPSGAVVRVTYPVQLRSDRRMWWDRRLWRGKVVSSAVFDPVTGRYLCELILDEVIVATKECEGVEEARQWLLDPPSVRLSLEGSERPDRLRIRVRAIFSSSTTWLIFPSVDGTAWVEVGLVEEGDDDREPGGEADQELPDGRDDHG